MYQVKHFWLLCCSRFGLATGGPSYVNLAYGVDFTSLWLRRQRPSRFSLRLPSCWRLLHRAVAKRGLQKALLPTASAGGYFAHILGLLEERRLNLNSACDVQWLLQGRGNRDECSKIPANALRRVILLLPPAAKRFVKEAIKGRRRVEHVERQELPRSLEHLRTGWYQGRDGVVAAVAPVQLPPLPSTASSGSKNNPATAGAPRGVFISRASTPLAVGFRQHANTCHEEHRPLMPSCSTDGSRDRG